MQVLQNQSPVAMVRIGLAAKKNRWHGEIRRFQMILNSAARDQGKKALFVILPAQPLFLLATVTTFFSGSEQGFMQVTSATNLTQAVLKVVTLAETGKLRNLVQAHVEQAPNPRALQYAEELFGHFFVKPMV